MFHCPLAATNHRLRKLPSVATDLAGTALLTDHYELTMVSAALRSGAARRRTVFEMFARHLPGRRRYGIVAGTGRFLDALGQFRFSPAEIGFLRDAGIIGEQAAGFLAIVPVRRQHLGLRRG